MSMTRVPSLISITDVSVSGAADGDFVVTNEATGRHFSADRTTVHFIDALRRTGDVGTAALEASILKPHADALVDQFRKHGIVNDGRPAEEMKTRGPVEGRLIAFRIDLLDTAGIARRFSGLGRLMYSLPGFLIWSALMVTAIVAFITNGDKVAANLALLRGYGVGDYAGFLALFIGLKLFHELGHILAYRVFCLRAGLNPGPIRTGLMIFAATPFPFTDVTGAWRLRSRWTRAAIGAGGIYFETFAVAVLTTYWAFTSAGVFHALILQVAVFSGAMTLLFNLNPAVKLDGYYILTDLLRQPNLSGRASMAARNWVARRLGADLKPSGRGELAYWLLSYVYRLTIFAGVFWIAYRFDPRLAPVVLVIAGLLLVVRPIMTTLSYAQGRGARPMRTALAAGALAGIAVLCFVPFPARILMDGQMLMYRTDFVRPPEASRLVTRTDGPGTLAFENPELAQTRQDLSLRREILSTMNRAVVRAAAEKAALEQDLRNMDRLLAEVDTRIAALAITVPTDAVWTPLAAERLANSWVLPVGDHAVGAVSRKVEPFVRLNLPQGRIDSGLGSATANGIRIRFSAAPDCLFDTVPSRGIGDSVARDGTVTIEAAPTGPLPTCAQNIRSGAAVVGRIAVPPKSIAERIRTLVARLLQNRLPIERETTT